MDVVWPTDDAIRFWSRVWLYTSVMIPREFGNLFDAKAKSD